ncbi:efflux RND transporter permease subunit [Salibacteraceae bacterium]|jgi:multidrug efflux pump subunit AcrB|nr:efflux RND transporter permease subunit [Salibacteraceae bacterium]
MADNLPKSEHNKSFGLSTLSLKNRTSVIVITFLILIGGLTSYLNMARESFPEVVIPQIYVGTPYPGNSPLDIEKKITRPLEKEIKTITGIDKLTSTSVQGYSTISVEFDFSVTPEEALRKVKDKVDAAMSDSEFPTDLPADPNIFEMNISELTPVMNINLSGNYSLDQLKKYAEVLEDRIEILPEISEVDIRGVQDKEMKVNVDMMKLEASEISFNDISAAINNENMTISGGEILDDNLRRTVRVVGEFQSAQELGNVIIKREKANIVYLKDIAEVVFEDEEKESYAREYTAPVVMVDVKKRAGENLINAADQITVILEDAMANDFPEDLQVTITNDQSKFTRTQVGELENSIIFGMLLVILVLLFFLGLRNALFVGVAIPMSMFMAFMILGAAGVTLNMMVLFSLVLALGMLVDNGIVVVENIYRLMDEGYDSWEAAKLGVGEVALPIIASTATTLAAFLPLAVWPGIMGQFMFYMPFTLMIVLGSSLFVALVINPVLTSMYMKIKEDPTNMRKLYMVVAFLIVFGALIVAAGKPVIGNLLIIGGVLGLMNKFLLIPGTKFFQGRILPWMEDGYRKFLSSALKGRNPIYYFIGTFGLLIFSFMLLGVFSPKVIFFPVNQPNYVNIFIEAPIGTDIEKVNEATKVIEKRVLDYAAKFEVIETVNGTERTHNYLIESVIAQVGAGTSDPAQGPSMANTPHKARVTISFAQFQFRRGQMTGDVMEEVRSLVRGVPGLKITVDKDAAGPPTGKPVQIEVTGDDYDQLLAEATNVKRFIDSKNIPGIEELKLDVEVGKPEMTVEIDRAKARRLNLSTGQIGMALRNALFGMELSSFKKGEDDYPIMVRLADEYRYNADALMDQKITFRDQTNGQIQQVPISAVASRAKSATFSAVKRKNMKRLITVSSNVLETYNPNEVVAEIKEALVDYDLPQENGIKFTGQQEQQAKEMAFLSNALMIAVFLIFLIMVSQFNSAAQPFIIIGSVVFSLIGVFLGLVAFQMDFVVMMTMVGIISLAGIVVNNAIVLLDYTNLTILRKKEELGMDSKEFLSVPLLIECIVSSGSTRLRPVLLTAITTVLGLLPLAVGMNINFFTLLSDWDPQIYFGGDNVMFWGPMSWTVIFGLTFATFLTLIIVPVMFYLVHRLNYRVASK